MSYLSENMSATSGNFSEASERNSVGTLCRLCMKKNDYYYNIFTSVVATQTTVEDALYDLVDLKVAVGDGLPATLCPLCLRKLIEFNDFRNICHKSDAELRTFSSRNYFRGEGASADKLGSAAVTKDSTRDANEGTSQPASSVRSTEIYIPVPDWQCPRENFLCNVKEEKEEHFGEENYSVLCPPDQPIISSNAADPLATDDLGDPEAYKCSSVKEDQISNDEEGYVRNDCADGASSTLMRQASSNQPNILTAAQGKKVEAQGTGAIVPDMDWTLVEAKKEPSPEENGQPTLDEAGEPSESLTMAHESTTEEFVKYFVIQFRDGCQIVPRNWLDSAKEYCARPPWSTQVDQRKYDKDVEKMIQPEESWKKYPVEKIRASGDDFHCIRAKLNEARAFSDTDTNSCATTEGKKKRRRIARMRWLESSDSDDEVTRGKSLTECTSPSFPIFNGSKCANTREEAIERNYDSNCEGDLNPGPCAPKQGRSNFHQESLDEAARMTDIEFKAYLISTLTALRMQVSMLRNGGSCKCTGELRMSKSTFNDMAVDPLQGLPALNVEEWLNFNQKLEEQGFANDVERALAQLGGSDLGSVIRSILRKVMSNSVGAQYSWMGGRGKRSMENLPFKKILISAVRQNGGCKGVTEKQIVTIASKWLSLSPQRGLKRRGKEDAEDGDEGSSAIA